MSIGERVKAGMDFIKRALQPGHAPSGTETPGFLARAVRVIHLLLKGYLDDDLIIHAASLTFVTLTSLVPVLTVIFAFAKGFGMGAEKIAELKSAEWMLDMPAQFQQFVTQVIDMVDKINVSALGGVGAAFFIFTAILILANVEKSFNRVWDVKKNRSLARQIMSYTSVLVLVPTLFILAGTLRAKLVIGERLLGGEAASWLENISLFGIVWLAIACLYTFVPNTRVRWQPALLGSLTTALVFAGWMKMFMVMQMGVGSRSLIYGAFAAIPVFMFWLYVTWVILLLGVEFTFALQNADTYYLESGADASSLRTRVLVALMMAREAGERQAARNKGGFDQEVFSRTYHIPIRLVNSVLNALVKTGYLVKAEDPDGGYVMSCRLDRVPLHVFMGDFMRFGEDREDLEARLPEGSAFRLLLNRMSKGVAAGFGEATLADLCDETATAVNGAKNKAR